MEIERNGHWGEEALARGLHRGPLVQELRDEEVGHRSDGKRRADAPAQVVTRATGPPRLSGRRNIAAESETLTRTLFFRVT